MFAEGPPPESPKQEDAATYLVSYLRDLSPNSMTYGYNLWLPKVVEAYARQAPGVLPQTRVPPQWVESLSDPFYAAAWDLCRLGVLRPGTLHWQAQSHGDGDGYCITSRGKQWLAVQDPTPFIPTDAVRTRALLIAPGARFGKVYQIRAAEAATCYATGAYYACCAMVGAAAECIALAVGISRLGERALKIYFANSGRSQLERAILDGAPAWLARDVQGHMGLIAGWRDLAAHADERIVTEGEAYMALLGLLRFANLVDEQWEKLTKPISPAPA